LRLAHGAFYSKTDSYLRLLEIVDGVRGLLERTERYYRSPHTLPRSRTEVFSESVFRFRAAQRELIALDPRFAALTLKHLRSIEPTRAPTRKGKGKRPSAHADAVRIAVTLCRLTGAFDAGDKTYGDVKRWFAHALAATPERRDARSKRNKSGRSKISR